MTLFKVLKPYPANHRFVIVIFVIDIFAWLIAPFSRYYIIPNMEVLFDMLCFLSLITIGQDMTSSKNRNFAIRYMMACLAIILLPVLFHGDLPFVSIISKLFFAISFISLKSEYKWTICSIFTNLFTFLLLFGIIEWVLLLFGINFFWGVVDRDGGSQEFYQGIFILVPTYSDYGLFYRFMSLCEEPGNLGTICFFLLATLDFQNNKRQFMILLLSGLISFSLGFYVLLLLWAITQNRRLKISQILLGIVVVVVMLTMFGDFFEARILDRVTGFDIETIDNRTNDDVDKKLQEISNDSRIVFGMGNRTFYEWEAKVGGVSAGLKNFVIQYGVFGFIILLFSFSLLIIRIRGRSKETIILLVFVWITFYKSNTWNNPPVLLPLLSVPVVMACNNASQVKSIRAKQLSYSSK